MYDDIYISRQDLFTYVNVMDKIHHNNNNNDVNITSGIKTLTSKIEDFLIFDRIH